MPAWSTAATTHLVTEQRKNTAKNILAWVTSRPVVTPAWVEALAERSTGFDPVPSELDFTPDGATETDSVDQDAGLREDSARRPRTCWPGHTE